ncbi:MAG: molybdopterin molybdotransferase MoeA [Planctomycetota bacterium]|nr:molybdopterin molybdotransferase MoeA [Planctomycetota bacterium]
MHSVEEALEAVRKAASKIRPEVRVLPLEDAFGRVLVSDVEMDHDMPPFDRATMDGFALRVADAEPGATLDVAGVIAAGDAPGFELPEGAAARIMTGAPVPPDADFVVPFEWTTHTDDTVTIDEMHPGPNIAKRGSLRQADEVVGDVGQPLTAAAIGALAAAGAAEVEVAVRPRVAILGTGSELVSIDEVPGPGSIRNSNAYSLGAQVTRVGGAPLDLGFATDDEERLRGKVHQGLAGDVLLLSGGVSQGDFDLVPKVLAEEGVKEIFHRWAVQPGGPLWFGAKGDTLVFGLPGNPAATFVGFELLVVPAIRAYLGLPVRSRPTVRARYTGRMGGPAKRRRFRPVALSTDDAGQLVADPLVWRGSGDPFVFTSADGLVVLPENTEPAEGEPVLEVIPVSDASWLWGRA